MGPAGRRHFVSVVLLAAVVAVCCAVSKSPYIPTPPPLPVTSTDCAQSDQNLMHLRTVLCSSFAQGPTWWCGDAYKNVTAKEDWPNQAVYMYNLLDSLAQADTCLMTFEATDTITWLNSTAMSDASVGGNFAWNWLTFQVQYYDMPRKAGARIESPDTLGRKCWAFAYLAQMWQQKGLEKSLTAALTKYKYNFSNFTTMYNTAIPLTYNLCQEVMANCFQNTTYNPSRNGTCTGDVFSFHYLGFERENLSRDFVVTYPFYPA